MPESIERIAYREAGRAVVCTLVGGRRVLDVTTEQSGDKPGETRYEPRHRVSDYERDEIMSTEVLRNLTQEAMIGYAGEQAEVLRFGDCEKTHETDPDYLVFLLVICADIERDQIILDVKTLLEDNWDRVKAVAEALMERKSLSGKEIYSILG